jgi:hypothetical protein
MSSKSFGRTASPKLGPRTELEGIDWHDLAGDDPMDEVTDLGKSFLERGTAPRISPARLLRHIVQHLTCGRQGGICLEPAPALAKAETPG